MKKIKIIAIMLVCILSMQIVACAASPAIMTASVQPRGRYLLGGGCSISPEAGYVLVDGYTETFEDVNYLYVELTVFKEISPGCWLEVWSDSISGSYDCLVRYTTKRISVDSGYNYMVEATHTVSHNGVTETNYSETDSVYVPYN